MRFREKSVPLTNPVFCGTRYWRHETHAPDTWLKDHDVLFYTRGLANRWGRSADRCYDQLHKGPPYLSGGPLDIWKVRDWGWNLLSNKTWVTDPGGIVQKRYDGGFICTYEPKSTDFSIPWWTAGNADHVEEDRLAYGNVSSYGAVGWNKYRPGQPGAGIAQFLAEVSQVPRMLKKTAEGFKDAFTANFGKNPRGNAKKAADHWLNHQYGWIPFVSDLQSFHKTWKESDKIIDQLRRDNNQWIKRSGTVALDREIENLDEGTGSNLHYPDLSMDSYFNPEFPDRGWWRVNRSTSQRAWFTGRFKYWIPDVESVSWERKARRMLYGSEINPSLVWELTPWSWLVDWGSNVGDVAANLSDGLAENLVAKYAYISGTKTTRLDVTSHMPFLKPMTLTWSYQLQRKTREAANPFGFGLTSDDLSARQFSILGALGVSRYK